MFHVTCRLTAKNRAQLRNPTLGNRVWATFTFTFLLFWDSPTGQTRRRVFTLDGPNDADSRLGVPLGGFIDIVPHFGCEITPKPQLFFFGGGRHWRFQAKQAKY